jgi:hypothetical protein
LPEFACYDFAFIVNVGYLLYTVLPGDKGARMPVGDVKVAVAQEIAGANGFEIAQRGVKPREDAVNFLL